MAVDLIGSACPAVQAPVSTVYRNSTMDTNALVTPNVPASTTFRQQINQIGAVVDQMARYGAGVFGIPDGPSKITLTAPGSGLLLQVSAGHAMIGGPVEIAAATTISVPDNTSRVFIWLRRTGALAYTTTTTPPSGESCLIGNCTTSAGNIVSIDYSGVVYLRGGIAWRETNDDGAPSDTPPANVILQTKTAFCVYHWDGGGHRQQYVPTVTADPANPGANDQWYRSDLRKLNVAGDPAASPSRRGCLLTLCQAFTPAGTGADIAELVVPFDAQDGTTSVTWNVRRITLRVNTAGGAPAVTIEKSTASTGFSAATVGTVTLASGAYEGSVTATLGTVASGNKLRFNVGALGTATGWTIEVLLGD